MHNILLSILFSTLLIIIFKLFRKYEINILQAILINYITAAITGFLIHPFYLSAEAWIPVAGGLGVLFVIIFLIMAITTQQAGIAVASVAAKMSMVIPITVSIFYLHEKINYWQWAGITTAILSVFFISYHKEKMKKNIWAFILPVLLFLGSGLIDTSLNLIQKKWIDPTDFIPFISVVFFFAFASGIIYLMIKRKQAFTWKSIMAGVVLGLCNWGSLYFLLHALSGSGWQTAVVFAINNLGIVLCAAIAGIGLFKERYSTLNYIGLALSIITIALLSFQ